MLRDRQNAIGGGEFFRRYSNARRPGGRRSPIVCGTTRAVLIDGEKRQGRRHTDGLPLMLAEMMSERLIGAPEHVASFRRRHASDVRSASTSWARFCTRTAKS